MMSADQTVCAVLVRRRRSLWAEGLAGQGPMPTPGSILATTGPSTTRHWSRKWTFLRTTRRRWQAHISPSYTSAPHRRAARLSSALGQTDDARDTGHPVCWAWP